MLFILEALQSWNNFFPNECISLIIYALYPFHSINQYAYFSTSYIWASINLRNAHTRYSAPYIPQLDQSINLHIKFSISLILLILSSEICALFLRLIISHHNVQLKCTYPSYVHMRLIFIFPVNNISEQNVPLKPAYSKLYLTFVSSILAFSL